MPRLENAGVDAASEVLDEGAEQAVGFTLPTVNAGSMTNRAGRGMATFSGGFRS